MCADGIHFSHDTLGNYRYQNTDTEGVEMRGRSHHLVSSASDSRSPWAM